MNDLEQIIATIKKETKTPLKINEINELDIVVYYKKLYHDAKFKSRRDVRKLKAIEDVFGYCLRQILLSKDIERDKC